MKVQTKGGVVVEGVFRTFSENFNVSEHRLLFGDHGDYRVKASDELMVKFLQLTILSF